MGGFGPDGYDARTDEELAAILRQSIDDEYVGDLEPYPGAFASALVQGFATAVHENQEQDLEDLYDSLFIETAEGAELTKLARGYGVRRRPAIAATGVVEFSRTTTGSELVVPSGTQVSTEPPDAITYVTTEAATFASSDATAQANITAVDGGTEGNVGADRVTRMPSPPAGVQSVTNPQPVGDPTFTLTDGTAQTLGQDRETDAGLRERVLESSSIGGAATVSAVRQAVRALDGSPSLTIYFNRELTDNANGNGLPKLSTELVIYSRGATAGDIATALHDSLSIGDRLVSGINGTSVTETVTDTALAQDRTLEWSEPATVALSVTVDVVTEAGYAGDEVVKRTVADYIGGTRPDGGVVAGLDVGDDVIVDELERRINSLQGVLGVASVTIDADADGTDDTTTRSDGLTVYAVPTDEIATVDATTDVTVN